MNKYKLSTDEAIVQHVKENGTNAVLHLYPQNKVLSFVGYVTSVNIQNRNVVLQDLLTGQKKSGSFDAVSIPV